MSTKAAAPRYLNREIDQRFIELERRLFDEDEGFLPRIEQQTIRTNDRVTKLEKFAIAFGAGFLGLGASNVDLLALLQSLL